MSDVYYLADEGVGYLTMREFNKARWAYDMSHPASPFMEWLKTAGHVDFTATGEPIAGSADPSIPIPATKLAWEEITRLSNELNPWPGVEEAAGDQFGAYLLQLLSREVSTAVHRWPMEDKPHRITDMRCGGCGMLTLIYRPPRFEGDEVKADCSEKCGFELLGDELMLSVELLKKEELERQKEAKKRVKTE